MPGVAYERFKRALALEPSDPYVLATAGNGIAAFDDPDAERALRTAALTAPNLALGRLLYGAYLSREGFLEEGLTELRAARELDPDDPQIAYELAVAYALSGRHEEAADTLSDAVRLDPDDGWVRCVFGLVLVEARRAEEGAGELISGARISEEDVDAALAAALAAAAIGQDGLAYEMLERARLRATAEDLAMVTAVEERIDAGPEAAEGMLSEELGPDLLRSRLLERP
jgi:Flp pilus assembly protein TadD